MRIIGVTPPFYKDSAKRCHNLGLRDDPETALGFPSSWNCCHHAKPVSPPNLEHQRNFCLTREFANCPVYSAEQKRSLPKELRIAEPATRLKKTGRWIAVLAIILLLIGSGLIFSGYWSPPWAEKLSIPGWISRAKPEETETYTNIPVIETDTPTIPATPNMPTEDLASTTQIEPASARHCAYPLETLIGMEGQFLVHQVEYGESMITLTENYQTTAEAIGAVNYFFPSPLWAELVIVIPLGITEVDDLPSLRPVLLDEDDISIEELADDLSVSTSALIEFNQMDLSCRSFHGWVLIPAEKINP